MVKLIYGGLPPASDAEAINNYKKAIALAPGRILHHLALAKAYDTTGERKLAVAELQKCRTLKPMDLDDAAAQKEAAVLLGKMGE
jgi:Tfp pilus assembly protein PilF